MTDSFSLKLTKKELKLTYWALIGYKDHPWGEDHIDDLELLIEKLESVEDSKNDWFIYAQTPISTW